MTIKVVRGNPTPEELAAALAVVRARAAAAVALPSGAPPTVPDAWSDPSRIAARRVPQPGPASWSRTYWPGG
ncbi:acyl-CoA carboxylase epsilon subunit [Streptomyces althioticus]|uniref:acyl-CoA carboxylase epsilon subunit n=1 Tax=Streptomyces althioticus TaxID=83380 RepID=UPI0036FBE059